MLTTSEDGDAPTQTLTLLTSLHHRSALRVALSNRSASAHPPHLTNPTHNSSSFPKHYAPGSIQPILRWCISHISDFRTTRLVVDVSLMLLDIYGGDLGKSEEVDMLVENLHRRVKVVVDASQMSLGVLGMLGTLEEGGRAATEVS
jgi:U3 small nucleolar RNA-associated protein 15